MHDTSRVGVGYVILLATVAVFAPGRAALAGSDAAPTFSAAAPRGSPGPVHVHQGGDTIESATPIPSLPFADTGTTVGYANDYAGHCSWGSGPDVVYRYAPAADVDVDISLCGSSFDTELYVYEDTAGHVIACNDWFCGYQSQLLSVAWRAGHTYYVVVDVVPWEPGYAGGAYAIGVDPVTDSIGCPPGAWVENEPTCYDGYEDTTNGGCNSTPPVFQPLMCFPRVVCGEYGGFMYEDIEYRDTDWFQVTSRGYSDDTYRITVRGETATLCGFVDGRGGCGGISGFYAYATGPAFTDVTVSASLPAGTWWLFVGPESFGHNAGPCGLHYRMSVTGPICPLPVTGETWGRIKAGYR